MSHDNYLVKNKFLLNLGRRIYWMMHGTKWLKDLGGIAACNNLPQEEQALEHAIMIKKTHKPAAFMI